MIKKILKIKNIILLCILIVLFIIIYIFSWNTKDILDKKDNYRIVNYNIKYADEFSENFEKRKDIIINQLLSYDADFITLQEANYGWMHSENSLPDLLSNYNFVGVGREDGIEKGEYAPIFYLKDKYELIDSNTIWLSDTPDEVSIGWDASTYRIMTSVTLKDKKTNEIIVINNTHLDHESSEAIDNSIDLIMENLSKINYPYILTGDMNFPSFYPEYFKLTTLLDDTKNIADSSMKLGTINYNSNSKFFQFLRIDYIFVSENDYNVINYRIDSSYKYNGFPVSDHFPIIVDFKMN